MPLSRYAWDGLAWRGFNSPPIVPSDSISVSFYINVLAPQPTETLPTGPGYIHYDTLKARATLGGAVDPDIQTVFDQLGTSEFLVVTMGPGVYETKRAWGKAPLVPGKPVPGRQAAFLVPKACRGIWGSGRGVLGTQAQPNATIIRVTPMTCSSTSEGGSWMQSGGSGSGTFILKNLQIAGTEQGFQTEKILDPTTGKEKPGGDGYSHKLFTNYFANNHSGLFQAEDVLSTGAYGNNGAPPGETFMFQVYGCDNHILRRVEGDGRREPGGPSFGSVAITAGNCRGAKWYDCYGHHINAKTYHLVYFQVWECQTFNCRLGDRSDGDGYGQFSGGLISGPTSPTNPGFTGGGFNQERAMDCKHTGMDIYNNRKGPGNPDKSVHFNHASDEWSSSRWPGVMMSEHQSLEIIDSTWYNHWGAAGNPLYISAWDPYGGRPSAMTVAPNVINDGVYQKIKWAANGYVLTQTPFSI